MATTDKSTKRKSSKGQKSTSTSTKTQVLDESCFEPGTWWNVTAVTPTKVKIMEAPEDGVVIVYVPDMRIGLTALTIAYYDWEKLSSLEQELM
jgi:hypothetical protein